VAGLRTLNGVQVFERQTVGTALPDEPSPTLRWTITAFAPRGDKTFAPYELNVIGLTVQGYQADEAFLQSVVDSLTYDAAVDGGGTTDGI
jgi:hypothetical protein